MLPFARARTTDRKLRLFAVACCKNVWSFLPKYSRAAVGVAELYADGFATIAQLKEAEQQVSQDAIEAGYSDGTIVCGSYAAVKSAWIAAEGASRATTVAGWKPMSVPKPVRRNTAEHLRVTQRAYEVWRQKRFCEQAHLLRDICNPFHRNVIGVFPSTVIEFEKMLQDLDTEMENILDPMGFQKYATEPRWVDEEFDKTKSNTLTAFEQKLVGKFAEALEAFRESDEHANHSENQPRNTDFQTVVEHGFRVSCECTPVDKKAYRLCWLYSCWKQIEQDQPLSGVQPVLISTNIADPVLEWAKATAMMEKEFRVSEWCGNSSENIRVNYKKAFQ